MKAIEQYFHVVLFIMLYKVVPTLKSVDKTLVYGHANENYCVALSGGVAPFFIIFRNNENLNFKHGSSLRREKND